MSLIEYNLVKMLGILTHEDTNQFKKNSKLIWEANLVITWSRNQQSRLRSDPGKLK